jgi:hypothetical protein
LAGTVIASHYAEPIERALRAPAALRLEPSESAEIVQELEAGDSFALLDNNLGWGWGYAGSERRVGYVRSEALGL